MPKKVFIFLFVLSLPLAGLAAQEGTSPFISIDVGYLVSTDISNLGTYQLGTLGLNVRVANPMTVGIILPVNFIFGGFMVNVKYDVTRMARAVFALDGTDAALGFEIIPFTRQLGSRSVEVKFAPSYNFPFNNFNGGTVDFNFMMGIGL